MYSQTTLQKLRDAVSTTVHSLEDLESVSWLCDVLVMCHLCIQSIEPLMDCMLHEQFLHPYPSHKRRQMHENCPSDCIRVVHPNTEARTKVMRLGFIGSSDTLPDTFVF